jgi:hypothetical protein
MTGRYFFFVFNQWKGFADFLLISLNYRAKPVASWEPQRRNEMPKKALVTTAEWGHVNACLLGRLPLFQTE